MPILSGGECRRQEEFLPMESREIIEWLLSGDVSLQYQVYRDLLMDDRPQLRLRIGREGWGAEYLARRRSDGHWGLKFYQPKWTYTHYTLLDLRNLCLDPDHPAVKEPLGKILWEEKGCDGGINPAGSVAVSDVCINGMFLNYASWFKVPEADLRSAVDFILSQKMPDGGFNCRSNRSGAIHSSLHTTLSVLEGITEYERNGCVYRLAELREARAKGNEFILLHRLFLSDKTGRVIDPRFLTLSYPGRWYYDILRALRVRVVYPALRQGLL